MAGIKGNQAYLGFAKQSAKATIPTVPDFVTPFTGGNAAPTRDTDVLAETDSTRQAGATYVRQTAASGSPEVAVRDSNLHRILELALGAKATTGTTPNYTHTLTPASVLPYATFFKGQGALLYEQYEDAKVNELTISADAGSPLLATVDFLGRRAVRKTTEWVATPAAATDAFYNFNEATVTLGGAATALVGSFELTISNNVSAQQTDDSIPYDIVEGLLEVSLGFSLIFETLAEYNKFHYGTDVGTAQTNTVFTTSAVFDFSKGANNSLNFSLPNIAYTEFPVAPDAGGDAIVVDVVARAERSGSPYVTAVVKNQVAL